MQITDYKFTFNLGTDAVLKVVTMPDGNHWFVRTSVLNSLNLTTSYARRLDEDETMIVTLATSGGDQQTTLVSESGLYHLTFASRKPEAKAFRRWVTSEVLPTLRKEGEYRLNKALEQVATLETAAVKKDERITELHRSLVDTMMLIPFHGYVAPNLMDALRQRTIDANGQNRAKREFEAQVEHLKPYKEAARSLVLELRRAEATIEKYYARLYNGAKYDTKAFRYEWIEKAVEKELRKDWDCEAILGLPSRQ